MRTRFAPRLTATWLAGVWLAASGGAFGQSAVTDALHEWGATLDTARKEPLTLPVGDLPLSTPWVLDNSQGGAIRGAGALSVAVGETETATVQRSSVTRITASTANMDPMIHYKGNGLTLDGITFQGWTTDLLSQLGGADANYANVGLLVDQYQTGDPWGPGNIFGENVSFVACKDAIKLGVNTMGNQSDFLSFQKLTGIYCNNLYHSVHQQVCNLFNFQTFAGGVDTIWKADLGGNFGTSFLYAGAGSGQTTMTILDSGAQEINHASFYIGGAFIDGSIPEVKLFDSDTRSAANLTIEYLSLGNGTTDVDAKLEGENRLYIKGGSNLPNNVLEYEWDTTGTTKYPSLIIRDAVVRNGVDPLDMVESGTGTAYVLLDCVQRYHGNDDSTLGIGDRVLQTWNDGVLQSTETWLTDKQTGMVPAWMDASAEVKSIVTDETGSGGALVFATSPTIETATINGGGNAAAITSTGYSLTGSSTTPLLNLSGTWNTSGVPSAIFLNIADVSSSGFAMLLNLAVDGASKFSVTKTGGVTAESLSLTTDLSVANGGTGTSTLTGIVKGNGASPLTPAVAGTDYIAPSNIDTSSELDAIVSDDTGDGALVFATSPTLTTPNIPVLTNSSNNFEIRNGTNAQFVDVYNTYSNASNYERLRLGWSANFAIVKSQALGSGTLRDLALSGNNVYFNTGADVNRWYINSSGHFLAQADNSYDIGASAASRPRDVHVGRDMVVSGNANLSGATELTIASDAVTVSKSYHRVDTQGDAATDNLATINGGTEGDLLILRAENGSRDVVVKDGAGNIQLNGDMTLDNVQDTISLIFDGSNWLETARSNNGS